MNMHRDSAREYSDFNYDLFIGFTAGGAAHFKVDEEDVYIPKRLIEEADRAALGEDGWEEDIASGTVEVEVWFLIQEGLE